MKKYVIINGKDLYFISALSIGEASNKALSICKFSNEVIVREFTNVEVLEKVQINQNVLIAN